MKALIKADGSVQQIVANGEEFPVHPSMSWINCSSEITTEWTYDSKSSTWVEPLSFSVDNTLRTRIADVSQIYGSKLSSGYTYTDGSQVDHIIQTDQRSIEALHRASARILRSKAENQNSAIRWRTLANENLMMTDEEFAQMAQDIYDIGKELFDTLQDHKDALRDIADGAGTDDEKRAAILAYDITQNWLI